MLTIRWATIICFFSSQLSPVQLFCCFYPFHIIVNKRTQSVFLDDLINHSSKKVDSSQLNCKPSNIAGEFWNLSSLWLADEWNTSFSSQLHKVPRWSLGPSRVIFLFWHHLANEMLSSNTILLTDPSLIGFLKCFPCQHGGVFQRCQKPFVIHLLSVEYGGALLCWACESRPPSYFLISGIPPTLPFHHMVISCSLLKWAVWMLICPSPRSKWKKTNLLFSCCCPEQRPHLDPRSLLISLALDPSSFVIRSESGPLKRS